MSDEMKYQQMMGDHVDRKMQREWRENYSPDAYRNFSRPAVTCQICGTPMYVNPVDGTNHEVTEWERKWSVHRACAEDTYNRLDRETGVLSERRK